MTQEDKELLLRDLSSRLPYGVKCINVNWSKDGYVRVYNIRVKEQKVQIFEDWVDIEYCKPYLRPMSSMTDDERKEYNDIVKNTIDFYDCPKSEEICFFIIPIEWLNKHHFDYRGLIEKGLALEAQKGMYEIVTTNI